jgi:hypothetical protein
MPPIPLGSLGAWYVATADEKMDTFPKKVGHAFKDTEDDGKLLSGYS